MPEPLRRISLELLSDGRLVIFHGRERAIFRQPIEAAIFVWAGDNQHLLGNQLQIQAASSICAARESHGPLRADAVCCALSRQDESSDILFGYATTSRAHA